jgi:hypothetical protein
VPPDTQAEGKAQEDRVRSRLVAEGYEQPYGITDEEIRRNLSIKGKCADFIGYNPQTGWWLIAESKGSDLEKAEKQLTNTLNGLLIKESRATGKITLQIHIKGDQFSKLHSLGLSGYRLRDEDQFLGSYDDYKVWHNSEIDGIRVMAVKESG